MTRRENFPVGSLLIRGDLREVVRVFYRFARAADDVADDPEMPSADKLLRLASFEAGLEGDPAGAPEGLALAALGRAEPPRHARALLAAFRRDAVNESCATWAALLAYCEDSANPVGRFLLDLHGESRAAWPRADALCTALQVLNHLQDLRDDHLRLRRHYLPTDWLAEEGARLEDLAGPRMTPGLRRAADRALDGCDELLRQAEGLPAALRSRRLAGEAATILRLARRLTERLRREDPLAGRVRLSRGDMARAALLGLATALGPRPAGPLRREEA